MKKFRLFLCSMLICMFALVGCTKTLSVVFNIENGDSIKVTLETDKDYKMTVNGSQFNLSETGESDDATGIFMLADQYTEWYNYNQAICSESVNGDGWTLLVIETENHVEYDYCFDIAGTDNTYVVVASLEERRDALISSISLEVQ